MMSDIESKTEPYRKPIGWFSIAIGLVMFCILLLVMTFIEHRKAQDDRIVGYELNKLLLQRQRQMTRLEDAIRDMVNLSDRSIIIYHAGGPEPGDEKVVNWPPSAEKLLGWTYEDVNEHGLEVIVEEKDREKHKKDIESALNRPVDERKTTILVKDAVCKDGTRKRIRVTTWVVGDSTRSIAAIIEPENMVRELIR